MFANYSKYPNNPNWERKKYNILLKVSRFLDHQGNKY